MHLSCCQAVGHQLTKCVAFSSFFLYGDGCIQVALTDRLLWCSKAAATMLSHPARTRLISSLRKQFLPPSEGPGLRLSVQSFRSLTSSLFLLLASLHTISAPNPDANQHRPAPSSPAPSDLHLVQDSINKV